MHRAFSMLLASSSSPRPLLRLLLLLPRLLLLTRTPRVAADRVLPSPCCADEDDKDDFVEKRARASASASASAATSSAATSSAAALAPATPSSAAEYVATPSAAEYVATPSTALAATDRALAWRSSPLTLAAIRDVGLNGERRAAALLADVLVMNFESRPDGAGWRPLCVRLPQGGSRAAVPHLALCLL